MASIHKRERKSGTRWIVYYDAPPDGKHKTRERTRTFTKRKDAVAFKAEVETSLFKGTYIDTKAAEQTIGELFPKWHGAKVVTKNYLDDLESAWRVHVAPRFAQWPIGALKPSDVQAFVSELSHERSASITNRCLDVLRGICKMAVKDGIIAKNPCDDIQKPRKRMKSHGERHYLTVSQLFTLAEHSGRWAPLVITLGLTGIRVGEARALRVKDVDFEKRRLHIDHATKKNKDKKIKGKWDTSDTKTHERRDVPMPDSVAKAIRPLCEGLGPDDLVFTDPKGRPFANQQASHVSKKEGGYKWWGVALKNAGLEPMCVHDLRHTAASIAVSSGANVKLVQRMLGHKDAAMTLSRYADLFDEDMDAVIASLDAKVDSMP